MDLTSGGGSDSEMDHDVVELAYLKKLDELHEECNGFAELSPPPRSEWKHHIPKWIGYGTVRGCKSWKKTGLCNHTVQEAITVYCGYVAIPGVQTGIHTWWDIHSRSYITGHAYKDMYRRTYKYYFFVLLLA